MELSQEETEKQLAGGGVKHFRHAELEMSTKYLHSWFKYLSLKVIIQGPGPRDTFCIYCSRKKKRNLSGSGGSEKLEI